MTTDDEWKEKLTPEQYYICREKGTERAFSGKYNDFKETGVFCCVCCGEPLFDSNKKYDSGSGWPSFWAPIEKESIEETSDNSHGMKRVEITCKKCGAHLGHVFDDGPAPSHQRYCVNSVSLDFKKS